MTQNMQTPQASPAPTGSEPTPATPPVRPRVLWVQNAPDHYFAQMVDALNALGDIEYFVVFLCPPPHGSVIHKVPAAAPYKFLGDPAAPPGKRRLAREARDFVAGMEFSGAIIGGYNSGFKRWVLRRCRRRGIATALFADSNIRSERGRTAKKKLRRFAKRMLLHWVIRRVDAVMPCNRSGVAYWRYYGCPRGKIARSTYYCAVDAAAAESADRGELFRRYGLDPGSRLIFTAARLVPAKALHLMVDAFKTSGLPEQGWVWAVAGGGAAAGGTGGPGGKTQRHLHSVPRPRGACRRLRPDGPERVIRLAVHL